MHHKWIKATLLWYILQRQLYLSTNLATESTSTTMAGHQSHNQQTCVNKAIVHCIVHKFIYFIFGHSKGRPDMSVSLWHYRKSLSLLCLHIALTID